MNEIRKVIRNYLEEVFRETSHKQTFTKYNDSFLSYFRGLLKADFPYPVNRRATGFPWELTSWSDTGATETITATGTSGTTNTGTSGNTTTGDPWLLRWNT